MRLARIAALLFVVAWHAATSSGVRAAQPEAPGASMPNVPQSQPVGFRAPWSGPVTAVTSAGWNESQAKRISGVKDKAFLAGVPASPPTGRAGFLKSNQLTWTPLESGGALARFTITSKGAKALRLGIRALEGGENIQFRLRGEGEAQVQGPWVAGTAALKWAPLTLGESVDVEVFDPSSTSSRLERFAIEQVSHVFRLPAEGATADKAIGSAESCERDVACFSLGTDATRTARTVLMVEITSGGSTYYCSGVLLNTRASSFVPYLLTTSTCVPDAAAASTVATWWFYDATSCGSQTPGAYVRKTGGAALLARDDSLHFALLRLNDSPPSGAWFSGWDPAGATAGQAISAYHHPQSDLKKRSVGSVVNAGARTDVQFTVGVTENGSVGSGIWRDELYLLGILYGGSSDCTNQSGLDNYSSFANIYSSISQYLEDSAPPASTQNYSDIWWNPNESGWGLTIVDHETQLFLVWYTYRQDGSPTWFVIPGGTFSQGKRVFTGDVYQTTGPSYTGTFNPAMVASTRVGSVTIDFAPSGFNAGTALFTYSVNGYTQTKQIQRQPFGDASPAWGYDFTDIWWDPNESGWGMTIAQHGNSLFAVWYTYDTNGLPLFVVMPGGNFNGPNSFTGTLYTTTGPFYGNATFDPAQVVAANAGTGTISYDALTGMDTAKAFLPRRGHYNATVRGHAVTKNLAQQPFGNPQPSNPTPPAKYQVFVTLAGQGSGTVTSAPAGISCGNGGACAASFTVGTTVTLTASPATNSRFNSFTGTCSSPNTSCLVSVTANANVTVTFDRLPQASTLQIAILANPLPAAIAGQPYFAVQVAQGVGGSPPYYYTSDTFANGAPPLGMSIDLNGFLTGTPSSSYTSATTFNFGVCVTDLAATTKCAQSSITVNPAQPAQTGTIKWTISDQCNNGYSIDYNFHDRAHNWAWPGGGQVWVINYGQTFNQTLSCVPGANVCVGARMTDGSGSYWGVNIDDSSGCTNCCGTCGNAGTYSFGFSCSSTPPPAGNGQCTGLQDAPNVCGPCHSDADCGPNVCWTGNKPAPFCH